MNPRICLFTDSLVPSGLGEHMLTLAAELPAAYDLRFVCPPGPNGDPLLARASALGLETLALDVRGPGEPERLRDWLRTRGVNVFHGHAGIGWEGHTGIYAAREAGIPVVVRSEHLPDLITDPDERRAYRRLLPHVDRLICVSEQACASFLATGVPKEKLRVIRNGIRPRLAQPDRDGVRARLGLRSAARLVLTVGRLTEQKGHRYLLEAIPSVLERRPDAHFVVVGEGPLDGELRERARALGLDGHVSFLGRRPDVPALLAAADLFVLPSLFEGLPLSVLEAMGAGLPVVGTRGCGTAEAVRDGVTGRLVPPRDPAALARAVLEPLEQPDLGIRWGAAGQLRLEQEFSAARMAREAAALYQELLLASTLAGTRGGSPSPLVGEGTRG